MRYRSTNGAILVLVAVVAFIVGAVGIRQIIVAHDVLATRRSIFVEMLANRRLAAQRDALLRQEAELTAPTRVAVRARVLLGMRSPTPREVFFVNEEEKR